MLEKIYIHILILYTQYYISYHIGVYIFTLCIYIHSMLENW